jgi:hypothetical protein
MNKDTISYMQKVAFNGSIYSDYHQLKRGPSIIYQIINQNLIRTT